MHLAVAGLDMRNHGIRLILGELPGEPGIRHPQDVQVAVMIAAHRKPRLRFRLHTRLSRCIDP